jgi:hypothetical protein
MVAGIAALIESRFIPRDSRHTSGEIVSRTTPVGLEEDQEILSAPSAPKLSLPSSITEHTTELLNKQSTSKPAS